MMVAGVIDMEGIDCLGPCDHALVILAEMDGDPKAVNEVKRDQVSLFQMDLRMRFNGHRHPVMFAADLDPELYEYFQNHREVKDAILLIRGSQKFGIRRGDRSAWDILQRLIPELKDITWGGETFSP